MTRGPMLDALESPGQDGGHGPDDVLATVDLQGAKASILRDGGYPHVPAPPAQGVPLQPNSPSVKMTVPLGDFLRNQPTPMPASAPPLPEKPRWQQSIDGMLIRMGRGSERQWKRFQEAPQNTQIIVVIVVGTLAILVLGFVLFLALH